MPWRLILFIVVFAVFLAFVTFNLENRCDINFGFNLVAQQVPVFITIFISFITGMVCTLPLIMFIVKKKHKDQPAKNKNSKKDATLTGNRTVSSSGDPHGA